MNNEFFVAVKGEDIVFLKTVPKQLTKALALNLAAWIVALADDNFGSKGGAFDKVLADVIEG